MPMETGSSEPPDTSQEVLRSALAQAAKFVSMKQIVDLAAAETFADPIFGLGEGTILPYRG